MRPQSHPGAADVRSALDRVAGEIADAEHQRADRDRVAARAYLAGKLPKTPVELEAAQRGLRQLALCAEYAELGPKIAAAQARIDALDAEGAAIARQHDEKYALLNRMNMGQAGHSEWTPLAPREIGVDNYTIFEAQQDVKNRLIHECEVLRSLNGPRQYQRDKILHGEIGDLEARRRQMEHEHRDLLIAEALLVIEERAVAA